MAPAQSWDVYGTIWMTKPEAQRHYDEPDAARLPGSRLRPVEFAVDQIQVVPVVGGSLSNPKL